MSADALRLDAVTAQSALRDAALQIEPAVAFQVPRDAHVEAALGAVDALIDGGHAELALRTATALDIGASAVAMPYEFMRADRIGRAQLAIGDDRFLAGQRDAARDAYRALWSADHAHPAVRSIATLAREQIESMVDQRRQLLDEMAESAQTGSFDRWCDQRARLSRLTILSADRLWARVESDGRALLQVRAGAPALQVLEPPTALPGSLFRVSVDTVPPAIALRLEANDRVPAALARPVIETLLTARARLLAVDRDLTLTGESTDAAPVFRYQFLRDRTYALADEIVGLDARTAAAEARLDDLNAVFVHIGIESTRLKEEIEAKRRNIQRITELHAKLAGLELAAAEQAKAIDAAADECETEWWEWAVGGVLLVTSGALGVGLLFGEGGQMTVGSILVDTGLVESGALVSFLGLKAISCADLGKALAERDRAMRDLAEARTRNLAELEHEMLELDRHEAALQALMEQQVKAQQQDSARALGTVTLDAMRSHYRRLRNDLTARARTIALMAQAAFNFEEDAGLTPIQDAYVDASRKGYVAGETLRADLQRLEQFRLTTRRAKRLQISHVVSLRQQAPMAFVALRATGTGRVAIEMADVDRAFPGTYLQRIREARVEVITTSGPVAARGYLSNEGLSTVRFHDRGERAAWRNADITPDPNPEIAALCYKLARQRHPPETAAFSDFTSPLFVDRSLATQRVERNFFENMGVETTWTIELSPDQHFDVATIVDVRLHVQFDAFFDDMLKRIVDRKRYTNRRETATFSVRELAGDPSADLFTRALTVTVRPERLPAPTIEKRIADVGFAVKPRQAGILDGPATLTVSIDGSSPATLVTDATGVVATAQDTPAGSGVAALAAAARGQSPHLPWTLALVDLPTGLGKADVEDVYLLFAYEYVTG